MGIEEHRRHGPRHVGFAVVTVSDTRTEETDETGRVIREGMSGAGHHEHLYLLVRDQVEEVRGALQRATGTPQVGVVIFNGGTGIAKRDVTVEALEPLLSKTLPGFGEIFRSLSFQDVGSPAILSRALAGVYEGRLVLALPGSTAAAILALEKLILPEIGHLVHEVQK